MNDAGVNPFERYDLDPLEGIAGITERMREHIRNAKTEQERAAIRADWVALTKNPKERLALCLGAHPESRRPLEDAPATLCEEEDSPPSPPSPQELLPFVSYLACFDEVITPIDTATPWSEDPLFLGSKPASKTGSKRGPRPLAAVNGNGE